MFQMRWYPYFSIIYMLALMFIVPHDPSCTNLDSSRVGSAAYRLVPPIAAAHMHRTAASELSLLSRHSTPAASATSLLLGDAHASSSKELLRLLRLARARPQLVMRAVTAALAAALLGCPEDIAATMDANDTLVWATTVENLRAAHGERQSWWGDLSPADTRALYHALLPTSLLWDDEAQYSLAERAEMAIAARRAARLYARERALLPFAIGCQVLDGVRQLLEGGSFRTQGYSDAQIWIKYAGCLPSELPDGATFDDDVYLTIIRKACSSNQRVDKLCGVSAATPGGH